jgi:hypothetical protein
MDEKTTVKDQVSQALANNFMLAKLHVRIWSGRKTDKDASAELLADKGAVANAAAVVKNLFAGKDASLKDTHAAYTRIRTWFYEHTAPWTTNTVGAMKGDRLIATVDSINFLSEFAKLKKQAEDAKDEFLAEYDQLVQDVAQSLGQLYDASQYPSKAQVATLFGAEMSLQPLPQTTDFKRLTNVPASLVEGLSDLYERNMEAQMNNALSDVQKRLLGELERMDTQLSKVAAGEKTRLFKSMVTNLKHLVGLTKSMNFTDNAEINTIADEIEKHLLAYEVDAYKDNAALARQTAERARLITKLVRDDDNWRVNDSDQSFSTADKEIDTQAVDSIDPEFTPTEEIEREPQNRIVEDDQNFLASLTGEPDDVPEDEIGDKKEDEKKIQEETPDFDESEFMFNNY